MADDVRLSRAMPLDGLPPGQRFWAVMALVFAIAMASLDSSIANTALPTIAMDVNASPASSVWVVNAYQLTLVATLLPFASLARYSATAHLHLRAGGVHRRLAAVRAVVVAATLIGARCCKASAPAAS